MPRSFNDIHNLEFSPLDVTGTALDFYRSLTVIRNEIQEAQTLMRMHAYYAGVDRYNIPVILRNTATDTNPQILYIALNVGHIHTAEHAHNNPPYYLYTYGFYNTNRDQIGPEDVNAAVAHTRYDNGSGNLPTLNMTQVNYQTFADGLGAYTAGTPSQTQIDRIIELACMVVEAIRLDTVARAIFMALLPNTDHLVNFQNHANEIRSYADASIEYANAQINYITAPSPITAANIPYSIVGLPSFCALLQLAWFRYNNDHSGNTPRPNSNNNHFHTSSFTDDPSATFKVLLSTGTRLFPANSNNDGHSSNGQNWCVSAGQQLTIADFNGDGKADLMCDQTSGAHFVLISTGTDIVTPNADPIGRIAAQNPWCTGAGTKVTWADFNGDGKADMICYHNDGFHWVLVSDGKNVKAPNNNPNGFLTTFCMGEGTKVTWADFNGDGKADLICDRSNGDHWVLVSDGKNVKAPNNNPNGFLTIFCSGGGTQATWADFNGDGKVDLICDRSDGLHWVLVSDGKNVKSPNNGPNGDLTTFCIGDGAKTTWADFNGDGKADMICDRNDGFHGVLVSDGKNVKSPNNNPNGDLKSGWCAQNNNNKVTITWTDFNGDGNADLICDYANGEHKVLLSTGSDLSYPIKDNVNSALVKSGWCEGSNKQVAWAHFNNDCAMDALCFTGGSPLVDTETEPYHDEL